MKTKKEVMLVLGLVIEKYCANREIMQEDHVDAKQRTLAHYSDFYEWLVGE